MQRLIKFCVKLGKNGAETLQLLQQVYKEDAMSRAMVFMWHKRFKHGREDVEDDDRAGRASTSRNEENLAKVQEVLNSDRRLSIRLIADRVNLNYGTVFQMVSEDLMKENGDLLCSRAHLPRLRPDFGPKHHGNAAAATLQPGPRPQRLLFVPPDEEGPEREAVRHRRSGSRGFDEGSEQHSSRRVPGRLPTVENSLAAMCRLRRNIF